MYDDHKGSYDWSMHDGQTTKDHLWNTLFTFIDQLNLISFQNHSIHFVHFTHDPVSWPHEQLHKHHLLTSFSSVNPHLTPFLLWELPLTLQYWPDKPLQRADPNQTPGLLSVSTLGLLCICWGGADLTLSKPKADAEQTKSGYKADPGLGFTLV